MDFGSKKRPLRKKHLRRQLTFEKLELRELFSVSTSSLAATDPPVDPPFARPSYTPPQAQPMEAPALDSPWKTSVDAGNHITIGLADTAHLDGVINSNTNQGLTIQWRLLSGPGTATITNANTANASATFSAAGVYEFELVVANEFAPPASDRVRVTVASVINIDQAWLANTANQGTVNAATVYILKEAKKTYVLQTDVTTAGNGFYIANRDITFDLNGHTIHYGGNNAANTRGVILYLSWHNTEIVIPGAAEPFNVVIENGSIINDGAGDRAHGIYGYRGNNVLIQNMKVTTDGKDSHTVYFANGGTGGATIKDNILTTNTSLTFNRHQGPANVFVGGKLVAEHNILIGGNSGFNVQANSVIHQNIIAHAGFATNGYGVFLYRTNNVTITDNLILPTDGRGIIFNAGENHTATGNVILHLERPNAEFGENLNPPAVRARYETSGIVYSNNTSLGIGGGNFTSVSSLYITSYGTGTSRFENNDATTILVGTPDIKTYAQTVTLEGTGTNGEGVVGPGLDVIANNHFKSNHLMLRVEGFDGHTQQQQPLKNNRFDWVNGSTAHDGFLTAVAAKLSTLTLSTDVRTAAQSHIATIDTLIETLIDGQGLQANRAVWQTKYVTHTGLAYMDVLDSNWDSGVDPKSYTFQYAALSQGAVKVREGFTKQVQLLGGGAPLANKTVTVTTEQGDSYQATTGANGFVTLTFYRFSIEKAEPVGSPFSVIDRTRSTITVGGSSVVVQHASVPNQIDLGATAGGQSLDLNELQSAGLAVMLLDDGPEQETTFVGPSADPARTTTTSRDIALESLSSDAGLLLLVVAGLADDDCYESLPAGVEGEIYSDLSQTTSETTVLVTRSYCLERRGVFN